MNRQEAEQLAERIRSEAPKLLAVEGVEQVGPSYEMVFAVKCACKVTGLPFVVKSPEHWEHLNEHIIVRLCKRVSRLFKEVGTRLA